MLFALTEQKLINIFKAVELGMPKTRAAIMGDVSQNAFARYETRGKLLLKQLEDGKLSVNSLTDEDGLCVKLVVGMEKARSQGLQNWLSVIDGATTSEWRAAAWLVERVYTKDFGKRIYEESNVTQFGVTVETGNIEDLLAIKRQMRDWEEKEFGGDDGT